MTVAKVAVSLPSETLERAKRAVRRGHAPSLSAYVTSAIEHQVTLDEFGHMLDEILAETGGPMTMVERKRVDRLLGPARRTKRT